MNLYQPLLSGEYYHIVNRAVGNEKVFKKDTDYAFFLSRYQKYMEPLADCFAWALLPNHFHFLIKIKEVATLAPLYTKATGKAPAAEWQPYFVMKQWGNLLNSYTKWLNTNTHRKGGLFIDATKRRILENDLCNIVFYIHKNPVHHGYCKKMENWKWSSYNALLGNSPGLLQTQSPFDWFGGRDRFLQYHQQPIDLKRGF